MQLVAGENQVSVGVRDPQTGFNQNNKEEFNIMKFECPNCKKRYDIPNEKLPPKKKIAFNCLQCKEMIELDLEAFRKGSAQVPGGSLAIPTETEPAFSESSVETTDGTVTGNGDFRERVLRKLNDLPPMPQVIFRAREIINDPDSEMLELAELLESDQAIATKVLKLANSAYYGLKGKVSSIRHASSLLGYNIIGQLISMAGTSSLMGKTLAGYELDSEATWHHSLLTASVSRIIALRKNPDLENDAFSAGLIHDVGKLVLDRYVADRKDDFNRLTAGGRNSMLAAERRILGLDHAGIGFEVCKYWNIPQAISKAIKYHHDPSKSRSDELSYIVFMANSIANMLKSIEESESAMAQMDGIEAFMYMIEDDALEFLGLRETDVPVILNAAREAVNKISEEMHIV